MVREGVSLNEPKGEALITYFLVPGALGLPQ